MKKIKDPDMRPEYDFSGGVRGKYFGKVDMDSAVVITGTKNGARKRAQAARLRNGKKRKRA